ncbi:P-loop containing nucleoside triphosphate hydrolase protein [Paraphysoderma sedebokerense]|nr:P-loop containing nucleoside triphosphate hydrolase protein [Paraphysoderma sedebokerense]
MQEKNDLKDAEKLELESTYEKFIADAKGQNNRPLIPEATANIVSWSLFSWMSDIMLKGFKRPLQEKDLYRLSDDHLAGNLCQNFESLWKEEQDRVQRLLSESATQNLSAKQKKKLPKGPSLIRTLFRQFGRKWYNLNNLLIVFLDCINAYHFTCRALAGFIKLIGDIGQSVTPYFLKFIVDFISESQTIDPLQPKPDAYIGYILIVSMLVLLIFKTVTENIFFQITMGIGLKIRATLTAAIFRKAMKLSSKARLVWNVGKITNVMSTDVARLDSVTPYIHYIYLAPIQIFIALGLLIAQLGPSALAGLGLMILFGPLQGIAMSVLSRLRKGVQAVTDDRVKLINESLQGIKIIKFFAYESAFLDSIAKLRLKELSFVRRLAVWKAAVFGIVEIIPVFASILVFIIYASLGNQLTPAVVFSSLALFNALRLPLLFVPMVISFAIDGKVAADRTGALLDAEELDSQPIRIADHDTSANVITWALKVSHADFRWESEPSNSSNDSSPGAETETLQEELPSLSDIDFEIPKGKLVAIVGRVGSGKSSLLNGIVGEMKRTKGEVNICGKVGYCPQQPWIQNTTLKENVLFGLPYDEDRYKRALHYAALERDLEILPDGDLTEIGEKGINLSGGQKSRINIARAIYYNPDIILLDDVLSAVDSHVGSFLFNTTIKSALESKTRILVTHALHFVPFCDYIIHVESGKIVEQGNYQELIHANGKFAKMMQEFGSTEHRAKNSPAQSDTYKAQKGTVDTKNKPAQLMTAEERAVGAVAASVYFTYFKSMGGLAVIFGLLSVLVSTQLARVGNDLWLSWWTANVFKSLTLSQYMGIYVAFGIAQAAFNVVYGISTAFAGIQAAKNLHISAITRVLYSPMSFFDTTPLGRIINRFSKDQDSVDNTLAESFRMFMSALSASLASFALIGAATPLFLIPLAVLLPLYYLIQLFFRATVRELKRLDSLKRSPLFAQFSESLSGIVTIRAYAEEDRFSEMNKRYIDESMQPYFLQFSASRWLSVRLEFIGGLLIFFAGLFGVTARDSIAPSLIGLSLAYALQITGVLNWCVRSATEVETQMNAVERISYYSELPTEADPIIPDKRPPESWPSEGRVVIEGLEMAYREGLPNVLHGINLNVPGGSKVGIVGRTGSGKSSIIVALLRLVEYKKGKITVDGIDISQIGLHDLRSRVAIIPQDPVLFAGTIRSNLDRFNKYSDEALWKTLEQVGLKEFVAGLDAKLDAPVTDNGENLSVGQRQLLCLARAMVVGAKLAILDEATASVDMQTDAVIQRSIRRDFKGSTILTIAHRLNTIIDYDYILVLDSGYVKEFAPPNVLLEDPKSLFSSMVDETGPSNAALLRRLAKEKKLEIEDLLMKEVKPEESNDGEDSSTLSAGDAQ